MKKRRLLVIFLIVVFCCGLLIGLIACQPAYYEGVPVRGVEHGSAKEIKLKSVDYRFNIADYPSYYDFQGTNSSVTVAYSYYNTTEENIVMPLYIEKDMPSYAFEQDISTVNYTFFSTAEQKISIRCAYGDGISDSLSFLNQIYDERITDDYYNADLAVYKYTFEFDNLSDRVNRMAFIGYPNIKIFSESGNSIYSTVFDDGFVRQYVYIDDTNTVTLYSVERELFGIIEKIEFFDDDVKVSDGSSVVFFSCETISFDDILMAYYDEESDLSAIDWYNAALTRVKKEGLDNLRSLEFFDMTNRMSYLYQCDLLIPAHTEVMHAVQMPLYPSIDFGGDVTVYEYNLDMSYLSKWGGTPNVNLSISTDGYYVESRSSIQLTPTYNGFESNNISVSTNNTASFALSKEPYVKKQNNIGQRLLTALLVVCLIALLIPFVVVWIVIGVDMSKRKKALNVAKETFPTDENLK